MTLDPTTVTALLAELQRPGPDILSTGELQELTGAKLAKTQREVLDQHGIFYIVRRDGSIRTTWHHVHHPRQYIAGATAGPRYDQG